jgi:hypothetical protein
MGCGGSSLTTLDDRASPPADVKTGPTDSQPPLDPLFMEVVAGMGAPGVCDGALHECEFGNVYALCRYGDALFVAEVNSRLVKQIDGVLGVADPMADSKLSHSADSGTAGLLERTLCEAVPSLPKELARVMVQYAFRKSGVRTICGSTPVQPLPAAPGTGTVPSSAAGALLPTELAAMALDDTDPVAGPQLLVGGTHGPLCALSLRTRTVTVVTADASDGPETRLHVDGPASQARFGGIHGIAVAPNGVLFVSDIGNRSIRRIIAAPVHRTGEGPPAERSVTTLIGRAGPHVRFAQSSRPAFQHPQ